MVGEGAHLCAAAAWDDTDVDFGLAKDGSRRGEDDVAHHRKFAAAAELRGCDVSTVWGKLSSDRMAGTHRVAADGGDDGLADAGYERPVLEELVLEHVRVCHRNIMYLPLLRTGNPHTLLVLHLLDVRARFASIRLSIFVYIRADAWGAHKPAKARSLPVSTSARTSSSPSNAANAWLSSTKSGEDNALRAFGRFSVMRPTPSAGREVRMYSYCELPVELDMRRSRRIGDARQVKVKDGRARRER